MKVSYYRAKLGFFSVLTHLSSLGFLLEKYFYLSHPKGAQVEYGILMVVINVDSSRLIETFWKLFQKIWKKPGYHEVSSGVYGELHVIPEQIYLQIQYIWSYVLISYFHCRRIAGKFNCYYMYRR